MDIYLNSQIVVQTAAEWAADTEVYSELRILITSDVYYTGTDQRKFKLANGIDAWSNLDYMPLGGSSTWGGITGTLSDQTDLQIALNAKQDSLGYTAENSANKTDVMSGNTTSSTKFLSAKGVYDWVTSLGFITNVVTALGYTPENVANKDATGGYAGLTLFKINFKNAANTFISFFTNTNTAARTYTFQDRNGTIADDTDLALKAPLDSPTFTGNPLAPTPSLGDNDTSIATTAFVNSYIGPDVSGYRKTGTTTFERWYTQSICNNTLTSGAFAASQLKYIPFIVSKTCTLDRIGAEVTVVGTAASTIRLGIYNSVNGLPNNLVVDAGTIANDSATFQTITINVTLSPGLYFFTVNNSATATMRLVPIAAQNTVLGFPSTAGATPASYYYKSVAIGTFASTAVTPDTIGTGPVIAMFMRLSA